MNGNQQKRGQNRSDQLVHHDFSMELRMRLRMGLSAPFEDTGPR